MAPFARADELIWSDEVDSVDTDVKGSRSQIQNVNTSILHKQGVAPTWSSRYLHDTVGRRDCEAARSLAARGNSTSRRNSVNRALPPHKPDPRETSLAEGGSYWHDGGIRARIDAISSASGWQPQSEWPQGSARPHWAKRLRSSGMPRAVVGNLAVSVPCSAIEPLCAGLR